MKTLKKVLAAFLAVLMLVFSVPFTALAADPAPVKVQIHVYEFLEKDYFGPAVDPADGNPEELSADATLSAGDVVMLVFGFKDTTYTVKGLGLTGYWNQNKLVPFAWTGRKGTTPVYNAYNDATAKGDANPIGMDTMTVADADYAFGFSFFNNRKNMWNRRNR